jgi:hypothetical protein
MYVWIWRHLPGGLPGKLIGSVVLVAVVVLLLFVVVFPWVGPKLPFEHVTVDAPTPTHSVGPHTRTPSPRSSLPGD